MFVGHYGPALAGPRFVKTVPVWAMCIAVQFLDYLWGVFVYFGIENVRIEPGFTAVSPLDLYDMPWTHSLLMAVVWSVVLGFIWSLFARTQKRAGAIIIGLGVFSHWLLDLLVHVPDLALWPGGPKVGFGLWNNEPVALTLEFGVLAVGLLLYISATRAKGAFGKIGPWIFGALLVGLYSISFFAPPPETAQQFGPMAIGLYTLVAVLAWLFCDRVREAK